MKRARYSDSQIINILKQAEAGTPVAELCREHGMSSASFYKWRSKYGGMERQSRSGKLDRSVSKNIVPICYLYCKQKGAKQWQRDHAEIIQPHGWPWPLNSVLQ
jgi:hypothetical protein